MHHSTPSHCFTASTWSLCVTRKCCGGLDLDPQSCADFYRATPQELRCTLQAPCSSLGRGAREEAVSRPVPSVRRGCCHSLRELQQWRRHEVRPSVPASVDCASLRRGTAHCLRRLKEGSYALPGGFADPWVWFSDRRCLPICFWQGVRPVGDGLAPDPLWGQCCW